MGDEERVLVRIAMDMADWRATDVLEVKNTLRLIRGYSERKMLDEQDPGGLRYDIRQKGYTQTCVYLDN